MLLLEDFDVVPELLGQIHLILGLLDVASAQSLYVMLVEDRGPGTNFLELRPNGLEQRRIKNSGVYGGVIGVLGINIPAAEHEVLQGSERHEALDGWNAVFSALSQTDGAHLGQGSNRFGQPFFDRFDSRYECGAHRADSRQEDTEFTRGGFDSDSLYRHVNPPSRFPKYPQRPRTIVPALLGATGGSFSWPDLQP